MAWTGTLFVVVTLTVSSTANELCYLALKLLTLLFFSPPQIKSGEKIDIGCVGPCATLGCDVKTSTLIMAHFVTKKETQPHRWHRISVAGKSDYEKCLYFSLVKKFPMPQAHTHSYW